jgi:hypothetical protein
MDKIETKRIEIWEGHGILEIVHIAFGKITKIETFESKGEVPKEDIKNSPEGDSDIESYYRGNGFRRISSKATDSLLLNR